MASLASILGTLGRGVARVPRLLDSALYQTNPVLQPEEDYNLPLEGPLIPGSDVPAGSVTMPTGGYRVTGQNRTLRPAVRRLLDQAPGIIESSIAAAATPNVAGGGPVDILRSLQVGMAYPRARRQEEEDRLLNLRKAEAGIEEAKARSGLYGAQASNYEAENELRRAQAEAARRQRPKDELIPFTTLGYIYNATTGEWIQAPGAKPTRPSTESEVKGALLQELANPDTPEDRRKFLQGILNPERPTADKGQFFTDAGGNVTYASVDSTGKPSTVPIGKFGRPIVRGPGSAKEPFTADEAQEVEDEKNRQMAEVADRWDNYDWETIKDNPALMRQAMNDEGADWQKAQAAYEGVIAKRTGKPVHKFDMAGWAKDRRRKLLEEQKRPEEATPPAEPVSPLRRLTSAIPATSWVGGALHPGATTKTPPPTPVGPPEPPAPAPQPQAQAQQNVKGTVHIKLPNGRTGYIPKENLNAAVRQGAQVID